MCVSSQFMSSRIEHGSEDLQHPNTNRHTSTRTHAQSPVRCVNGPIKYTSRRGPTCTHQIHVRAQHTLTHSHPIDPLFGFRDTEEDFDFIRLSYFIYVLNTNQILGYIFADTSRRRRRRRRQRYSDDDRSTSLRCNGCVIFSMLLEFHYM